MQKLVIGLIASVAVAMAGSNAMAGGFTDVLISGKKLVVKDNSAKGKPNAAIFKSKDETFVVAGFDPTISGATFQLINPFPGVTSSVFTLPQSNWSSKNGAFLYKDKDLSQGPVKLVQLKDGKVKVILKGGDFSLASAPLQQVGGIIQFFQPALTASSLSRPSGIPATVDRICFLFPGAQGQLKKDTTKLYKAVNAEAPAFCPTILD
jgi:hypothetical protein